MKPKIIPSLLKILDYTNVFRPNKDNMQEPPLERNYIFPNQRKKAGCSLYQVFHLGLILKAEFSTSIQHFVRIQSMMGGTAEGSRLEQRLHRD